MRSTVREVRLCETSYWFDGERFYCHAPAWRRDRNGMWVCRRCAAEGDDE